MLSLFPCPDDVRGTRIASCIGRGRYAHKRHWCSPDSLPYGRGTISWARSRIGSLEKSGSGAQISSGFTGRWPQNPRTIPALSIKKNDGRA